jgi:hypothetical protein
MAQSALHDWSWQDGIEPEPELVVPVQFFAKRGTTAALQPEKHLMLAVLADALGTFQKYANASEGRGRRLFDDAAEWIASDDLAWPFSCRNICHALDVDPAWLRAALSRWRAQHPRMEEAVRRLPGHGLRVTRHVVNGGAIALGRSA